MFIAVITLPVIFVLIIFSCLLHKQNKVLKTEYELLKKDYDKLVGDTDKEIVNFIYKSVFTDEQIKKIENDYFS